MIWKPKFNGPQDQNQAADRYFDTALKSAEAGDFTHLPGAIAGCQKATRALLSQEREARELKLRQISFDESCVYNIELNKSRLVMLRFVESLFET